MFSIGQMVYHKVGKRRGKVVECDGDTVYLVMENGVEVDFRSAELTVTPPDGNQQGGSWGWGGQVVAYPDDG